MKAVEVTDLTFKYRGDDSFALKNVSFDVEQGHIMLLIGESGCGKTTLLRHMKASHIPVGKRNASGSVCVFGKAVNELSEHEAAFKVGFVSQQVEESQVTDKVWHELAFGLESMGVEQAYMQQRVAEMTAFFGLENVYHEKLSELSGGQKQIVNLASVMIMEPEILVLDEPTSQLDPNSAAEFFYMIKKIHEELCTTIIIAEHRMEDIFPLADRVMVLDRGEVLACGTPGGIVRFLHSNGLPLFRSMPVAARIYCTLESAAFAEKSREELYKHDIPLSVNDGRRYLQGLPECEELKKASTQNKGDYNDKAEASMCGKDKEDIALRVNEVWFRYKKDGADIIKACSLNVKKGRITAILGGNGAGKSTLLHIMKGNLAAYPGVVKCGTDAVSLLPQNPQSMFAEKTVLGELFDGREPGEKGEKMIRQFDLSDCLYKHPFDLSGGQMEKLALAKLMLKDDDILLLDEPGKGMDYAFKEKLGKYLTELAGRGKTIVLVSHDVEFCAKYADYCGMFFDGHIVSINDTRTFFLQNAFYTTAVRRMCRGLFDAVTVSDVYALFGISKESMDVVASDDENSNGNEDAGGKKNPDYKKEKDHNIHENKSMEEDLYVDTVYGEEKHMANSVLPSMLLLIAMPLTIYMGYALLHQRKYYFISLMLILEAVTAFFISFEGRRPHMRDVMTIAVMSALTALSRAMFYMVPAVKPMAAFTIISGIGLGSVSGFVVGALSMLVSDIFFGQGPWTPWQMFTMGLLGFLSGVIFKDTGSSHRGDGRKKNIIAICIFGALSVLIVYGGIMNPASVVMYQENVTGKMLLASYIPGIPIDLIHAGATFIFLYFLTEPMLEKLERVKKK